MAQFAIDEVLTTGIQISGFIFDYSSSLGTPGQVLASTSSGVMWQADSSIVDLSSLSGQIAATGSLLNNRINSLSGYSDATFATITNLATTGSTLDTKINTLSGYSNANFATILNLAATGSTLDTKINTLSGYSNANFATILNLAATGSTLDTKINTLSGYSNQTFLSGVGVANYVPRWSGTKQLVTGNIYDDGTNVGIGTTIPGALLDVNGLFRFQQDIRVNNGTDKLILSATSTTTELHSAGAIGTIFKGAGNNEIARFDAANFNVGIGTATVSRKLHVYVDTGPVMRLQSSGSNASIEFIPSTIQNRYNWLIGAQQNISDAFEITPSTATNGTTFSNPAILVKSDGKVGIGNVSPTTLLSVGGAGSTSAASGITFGADSQANLYRISSSRIKTDGNFTIDGQGGGATSLVLNRSSTSSENGMAFITAGSVDWYYYVDNGNNNLQIQRAGENDATPRVRFDGSNSNVLFNLGGGNVGIGVTNPIYKLQLQADNPNNGVLAQFYNYNAGAAGANGAFSIWTQYGIADWFIGQPSGVNALTFGRDKTSSATGVEYMRIDAGGNIGIGITNPADKLHVIGNIRINGGDILNWGGQAFIQTIGANDMFFRPNSTLRMILTAAGNLGLGVLAPTTLLSVGGADSTLPASGITFGGDASANLYRSAAGALTIDGSLGIGTSPSHKLHLYGADIRQMIQSSTDNSYLLIGQWDGFSNRIESASRKLFLTSYTSGIAFGINGSENMTLDTNGNLGIGSTNPSQKLDVNGSARFANIVYAAKGIFSDSAGVNPVLEVYNTVATNAATAIFRQTTAGGNGNQDIGLLVDIQGASDLDRIANFRYYDGSTYTSRMAIMRGGNVGIGTTSPIGKLTVQGDIEVNYNSVTANSFVRRSFLTAHALVNRGSNIAFGIADGGGLAGMTVYNTASSASGYNSQFIGFNTHEGNVSTDERMRITQSGYVGIGTFTPLTLLSVGTAGSTSAANGLTFGGDASANLYRISSSRIKTDGSLEAAIGIISPTITSLSGNIAATGSTLDTKINTLSGYSNANFATILNLAATGSTLDTKINTTNTNLAATGSTLDTKINTTNTNLAATGSTLDTKINTTNTNLAATGSTLNARINSLSGYAGSTFLSGQGVANWTARWNGTKELITGSIYDLGTGVGIGTTSPNSILDVYKVPATSGTLQPMLTLTSDFATAASINFGSSIVFRGKTAGNVLQDNAQISAYNEDMGDNGYALAFFTRPTVAAGLTQRMTILRGGNVGIGSVSPANKLTVTTSTQYDGYYLRNVNGVVGTMLGVSATNDDGTVGLYSSTVLKTNITANGVSYFNGGNVGIGVASPTTLLSVGGAGSTLPASGITFGADASANLYRESDASIKTDGAFLAVGRIRTFDYIQFNSNLYSNAFTNPIDINIGNSAGNAWLSAIRFNQGGYVGIGTNQPSGKLHVVSSVAGETVLRADGTNGTLFSVVDDLSDSLMSVNNSAGLPVLEVFADDRVVAGQYGSGDFVIINNKVGIGTTNPAYKLEVNGNFAAGGTSTIGTTYPQLTINGATNQHAYVVINRTNYEAGVQLRTNGTAKWYMYMPPADDTTLRFNSQAYGDSLTIKNNGNVGIGTTNPSFKLHTAGAGFIGRQNNYGSYDAADADLIISNYNSDNTSILLFNSAGAYSSSLINYYNNILSLGLNNDNSSNLILTSTSINITAAGVGIGTSVITGLLNVTRNSNTAQPIAFFKELYGSPAATNILLLERGNNLSAANQTTSNAGLRIRDHSSDYSLSIEDHNSNVNFAISGSKVLVGSRGTNSLLNVGGAGSVAAASGLTFGEDASANLYRSAASTIKTDGNLVVAGTTSLNGHIYGKKTVTLTTASYTTVLTVNLTAHNSCYVKIGAFGDWGSHSAVAFVSELFIQNGDNAGYAEPGTIITAHDNTAGAAGDKIDIQIVDPAAAGTQDFLIQLKLISATPLFNFSSLITYHVMGQQASVT